MFGLNENVFLTKGARRATLLDGNTGSLYWLSAAASRDLPNALAGNSDASSPDTTRLLSELCTLGLGAFLDHDRPLPDRERSLDDIQHSLSMVYYEITSACNLSCIHCYGDCSAAAPQPDASHRRNIDNEMELLGAIAASGIRRIQFIGGEPFLHWDRLRSLCSYAVQCFEQVEISSNGTLLNDDVISFIKANNIKLSISLYSHLASTHDGITRCEGSHELTMKALNRLKEENVEFYIACVSMDRNAPHMDETIEVIRRQLDREIRPKPLRLTGRAASALLNKDLLRKKQITLNNFGDPIDLREFLSNRCFHNCYGRGTYIAGDGNVYPCVMERRISIGNVGTQEWGDILESAAFNDVIRLNKDRIEGCRDCEFRYVCFDCRPDASGRSANLLGKPWNCAYSPPEGRWNNGEAEGSAVEIPVMRLNQGPKTA